MNIVDEERWKRIRPKIIQEMGLLKRKIKTLQEIVDSNHYDLEDRMKCHDEIKRLEELRDIFSEVIGFVSGIDL